MDLVLVNVVRPLLDSLYDIFKGRVGKGLISHLHLHYLCDQAPLGQGVRHEELVVLGRVLFEGSLQRGLQLLLLLLEPCIPETGILDEPLLSAVECLLLGPVDLQHLCLFDALNLLIPLHQGHLQDVDLPLHLLLRIADLEIRLLLNLMNLSGNLFFDDVINQVGKFFGGNLFKVLLGEFVTESIPDELPIRLFSKDHFHELFHSHVTDFLALINKSNLPCKLLVDRVQRLQAGFELVANLLEVLVEDVASLLVHAFRRGEECHVDV